VGPIDFLRAEPGSLGLEGIRANNANPAGFDGGRARLGGFIGSAGRDIVVRCASLGELFMWCKRVKELQKQVAELTTEVGPIDFLRAEPGSLGLEGIRKFGFDGGRARLGGFIGSAGRDIVVRCASLGELFMHGRPSR
jgi:hypothetical protein